MGILIAIDGVDASGKQTQTELLYDRLKVEGRDVKQISFPAYNSPSSALVKMYLNGDFGSHPSDVNAYAASVLFASDRFASFRTDWGKDYNNGKIIIADRYVSSNLIHQASKLVDLNEKDKFLMWLDDLEYNVFSLPRPDATLFLDMPPEYGAVLMKDRLNKSTGEKQKDIHESDIDYLEKSYKNAVYVAKRSGWKIINCLENNRIRGVDEIHTDIYNTIKELI